MRFGNLNRGPMLDADLSRLNQLDDLIREVGAQERAKAEREAEEARRQAEALQITLGAHAR